MRKTSGGAVSDDFEKTTKPLPGLGALMAPPSAMRFGVPPAAGTV